MSSGRVLVIDDEQDVTFGIRVVLERGGFAVTTAPTGPDGLRAFHSGQPDLVILDVGLPGMDGWTVLERIRDLSDVPILMLTAHGQESEKVKGFTGGADDYLLKPFSNAELGARAQALVRRSRATSGTATGDARRAEVFNDGSVQLNFSSHEVTVDGVPVALTPTEYRLLVALVRHQGQVLSPEKLLELAWSDPYGIGPERVKYSILRLRRKLGTPPGAGSRIEAVRGFGYRYRSPQRRRTQPPGDGDLRRSARSESR
ncbi:MAG TPA: response regulator transcription factor [Trebonia sp.]|nr:response regulator transcription factor [Trebonia sp.]